MPRSFGVDLDAVMAQLDSLSRDAVCLVYLEKQTIAEAATLLDSTPTLVAVALMRGFRAVTQSLERPPVTIAVV